MQTNVGVAMVRKVNVIPARIGANSVLFDVGTGTATVRK